jgi:hypothetical protein
MATFSDTLTAGEISDPITTTPGGVVGINAIGAIEIQARNSASDPDSWAFVAKSDSTDNSLAIVATSDAIRVRNLSGANNAVEVFA